jgi:gliding motility-associated-like protein
VPICDKQYFFDKNQPFWFRIVFIYINLAWFSAASVGIQNVNSQNMKKLIYPLGLICLSVGSFVANAQTVVYSEDFDGAMTWTLNTDQTAEDSNPNVWYISCQEAGQPVGGCGNGCAVPVNNTLHVGGDPAFGDLGALYFETGFSITGTNRRAESANISTVGFSGLTLNFDMIGFGGNPQDYTEVFYSTDGGVIWNSIATPLTAACCGGVCDGSLQGLWQTNTYLLPAACDNIANLRISFVWKNVDDGVATDPSFAVDNIEITTPAVGGPTADFMVVGSQTICEGSCIGFMDMSTVGAGPYIYAWTFTGATPGTSAAVNPAGICYNTPGTYQVELSVTDGSGTDVEIKPAYITVVAAPDAGTDQSANLCNNTTLDLDTELDPAADPGGTWVETSGTPSGQFTAGTGVLDGNGLTPGNVYTFSYTVNPTAPCVGNDAAVVTVTIVDCSAGSLTASFTPSQTNICVGDCITFTENSLGAGIIGWGWQFTNGTPALAGTQNPGSVCFNTAGAQPVTLTVTDGTVSDDTTIVITVNALPNVTANANPGINICTGDPVTLTGSGATSYSWTGGVTNGVAFTPAGTQTYTVTGTDANLCQNTDDITITVAPCVPVVAGFSYPDNICVGDCITFTDTTSGTPISWAWDFGGGATPNTSTDQNPTACFLTAGTYDIQLTVSDAQGNNSSVTNQISVFDLPSVTATTVANQSDTIIDIGGFADLMAAGSGPGTFLWTSTPDDGEIDCDTCSSTFARPEVDTDFLVTFTDANGCQMTDTVFVIVNFIEGIGVPQAFSPNGDGNNDILFVKGYGIQQMNFKVYNRYGELVFEASDQNIGWDGKFKNRDENPGVFVWVLEYTFITGNGGVLKGNTTLVR